MTRKSVHRPTQGLPILPAHYTPRLYTQGQLVLPRLRADCGCAYCGCGSIAIENIAMFLHSKLDVCRDVIVACNRPLAHFFFFFFLFTFNCLALASTRCIQVCFIQGALQCYKTHSTFWLGVHCLFLLCILHTTDYILHSLCTNSRICMWLQQLDKHRQRAVTAPLQLPCWLLYATCNLIIDRESSGHVADIETIVPCALEF